MEYTKNYWLNEDSRTFLSRGYLDKEEKAEDRVSDMSEIAEKMLKKMAKKRGNESHFNEYAEKLKDYVSRGWYAFSSPNWSNFGKKRGLPISCFGSYIDDTTEDIFSKHSEVGIMTKQGGGTSAYFGALRPRGAPISGNGNSTGSVHFMELYDGPTKGAVHEMEEFERIMGIVSQGSVRRGSFAAYLSIDHDDFYEFMKIRDEGNVIQDLSFGVCISDKWMEEMKGGDKEKRNRWAAVINKRKSTGYPYLFFTDNSNNAAPQVYKDKGKRIYASNLCVAPETLLLTKEGHIPISSLEGQEVEVWNGKQWSKTTVVKTGEDQEMLRVDIACSEGQKSIIVTPYHKFYMFDGTEIRACDLFRGIFLMDTILPDGGLVRAWVAGVAGAERSDTYCVNEPIEHKAVFNGILTGNCNEIHLSSSPDESFVCCLSSMNLLHYDEWKDTDAVEVMIFFLDAVMEEFIEKTEGIYSMRNARNFAVNQRALGLGALGWHSYLQSKNIAFESMAAKLLNTSIWKNIRTQADAATEKLAALLGEPPLLEGYGRRNVTTLACAPNTSSSFILGQVSPSIEPLNSNYFVKELAKGQFTYKNPFLTELLENKGQNTDEVWLSILKRGGSVQHLEFLSEHEKDVFKTFEEISQMEIIIQASGRQQYIDQGQSINMLIPSSATKREISDITMKAWEAKLKGLYYQRSTSPSQDLARKIMTCKSCEA